MGVPFPADMLPLDAKTGRWKPTWNSFLQALAAGPADASYTVAGLPANAAPGQRAFASDGRKPGEGPGFGTGMLCFFDGSNWISVSSGTAVAA